jgi:hypothetical protein
MKRTLRLTAWWTAVVVLFVPVMAAGFAVEAVKWADNLAADWWDDFNDWAHQDDN